MISLAYSPSLPGWSSAHVAKPRTVGGEGLANIALDCVSIEQSGLTKAIHSITEPLACDNTAECQKAYTQLVQPGCLLGYRKLVLNSSWHFIGSQIHVIGIPEKSSAMFARPSLPSVRGFVTCVCNWPGREELVARL